MPNGSVTLYPASVDASMCKYASANSSYPLTRPIGKASSNTTYAQWNLTTGSRAETYVFYKFDCSGIPANATINSVSCSAKAYVNQTNSSRIATRQCQLYYGTSTAKGSANTISTSTTAFNMTCGTWTRAELESCYIRIYVARGTSNTTTTYYARFYGATLTISYTYQDVTYTVTVGSTGNGSVSPSGSSQYERGNDVTVTATPAANTTTRVTDNGTDVTSSLVSSGSKYTYTIKGISEDHVIEFIFTDIPRYTVNVSKTGNGSVEPSGSSQYLSGENLTITATPAEDTITTVTDNGIDVTASLVANGSKYTYTLRGITANHTIAFVFTDKPRYTIRVVTSGEGSTTPSGSTEVVDGKPFSLVINGGENTTIRVTDNGVDVTDSVVPRFGKVWSSPILRYETEGNISGNSYQSSVGKGYDAADTSATTVTYCSDEDGKAYVRYFFTDSSNPIPSNSKITRIYCKVKGHTEDSRNGWAYVSLTDGYTIRSQELRFDSTSDKVLELESNYLFGYWELKELYLNFEVGYYGGNVSGATLFVEYDEVGQRGVYDYYIGNVSENHDIVVTFIDNGQNVKIHLRKNGAYVMAKVYKKVGGAWVEQTNPSDVLSEGSYVKGN